MTGWTTVTEPMTVKGVDLTGMDYVWVSFADSSRSIEVIKDNPTVTKSGDDSIVVTTLSQVESGKFIPHCPVSVQVNWMKGTTRGATKIVKIPCFENLIKEVLPNV